MGVRFIYGGDRVPKTGMRLCTFCLEPFTCGYVRDFETNLRYCSPQCLLWHCDYTEQYIESQNTHWLLLEDKRHV